MLVRKRWLARLQPLQTIQSPRTEPASFATWVFPLAVLAPLGSMHVFALGGNATKALSRLAKYLFILTVASLQRVTERRLKRPFCNRTLSRPPRRELFRSPSRAGKMQSIAHRLRQQETSS